LQARGSGQPAPTYSLAQPYSRGAVHDVRWTCTYGQIISFAFLYFMLPLSARQCHDAFVSNLFWACPIGQSVTLFSQGLTCP